MPGASLSDIVSVRQWLTSEGDVRTYVEVRSKFITHKPAAVRAIAHRRPGNDHSALRLVMADFAKAMAMIIRAQLFGPDNHIVPGSQYNELFTMHGTIMVLLFAT